MFFAKIDELPGKPFAVQQIKEVCTITLYVHTHTHTHTHTQQITEVCNY
jgi:hypothetical protein